MKSRYFIGGLVALTAVLAYIGPRYQEKRRRTTLTTQLEQALNSGDDDYAVRLLHLGADANGKAKDGNLLIFNALQTATQDASVIRAFVAAGANVNAQDSTGRSLLSQIGGYAESLFPAQIEEMKCLLDAGANPNLGTGSVLANNAGGCGEACWNNPRQITLLLQRGAKLRKGDAAIILHATFPDDVDTKAVDRKALLQRWAALPIPHQERHAAIKSVLKQTYDGNKEIDQILAFLQHELRAMQSGPQHH